MNRTLPILCAAPVVRAILDGRQTQDRRPVKPQPVVLPVGRPTWFPSADSARRLAYDGEAHFRRGMPIDFEPWSPGDTLYVRETWAPHNAAHPKTRVDFRADMMSWGRTSEGEWMFPEPLNNTKLPTPARWRPSIHMPKWAARIYLRVLSVGVERVSAISEADARAEGCADVAEFAALWDRLYGAGSFDRGGWCWVTRFERVAP